MSLLTGSSYWKVDHLLSISESELVTELELQLFDKISISESELSTNGLIQTSPISNLQPDRDDTFESILSNQKQPIIASSTNNAGGITSGLSMCMTLISYPYSIFIQRNIILFLIMIRIRVIQSNLVKRKFLVIAKPFNNARLFTN